MIKFENHLGTTELHEQYFADLIGHTVTSCFGVAGMANSGATQNLRQLIFRHNNYIDKGVSVRAEADELVIDLHIIVTYGVNIQAIVDSIKNKVRYTVEKSTGRTDKRITVYVDGMKE